MSSNYDRESIWSLSRRWVWAYYAVFTIQMLVVVSRAIWIEIGRNTGDSLIATYLEVNQSVGPYVIPAAGLSFVGVLIGEIFTMLAEPFLRWRERVGRKKERHDIAERLDGLSDEEQIKEVQKLIAESKEAQRRDR